jgi:hypothetical protein
MYNFAYSAELAVSPTQFLELKSTDWQKGEGQFFKGSPPLKLYSNLKSNTYQIFVEDVFVPTKQLSKRLPSECVQLASPQFKNFCKAPQKSGVPGHDAVSLTSLFKTDSPQVTKVRTLYITGQKNQVSSLLASISTKPAKVSRK